MADPRDGRDVELREGDGLVRTTIVGGQPRKKPALRMTIKVGLERLLYLASIDPRFRAALLDDRDRALADAGLALSESEAAVLACVDRDALATLIEHVRPEVRPDRRFMKAVAATFLTLATGTAQVGCPQAHSAGISPDDFPDLQPDRDVPADVRVDAEDAPSRGITPDASDTWDLDPADPAPELGGDAEAPDESVTLDADAPVVGGILPDVPDVQMEIPEVYPDAGILPDVPPELPSPGDVPSADPSPDVILDSDTPVVGGIMPDLPAQGDLATHEAGPGTSASLAAAPRPDRGGPA